MSMAVADVITRGASIDQPCLDLMTGPSSERNHMYLLLSYISRCSDTYWGIPGIK